MNRKYIKDKLVIGYLVKIVYFLGGIMGNYTLINIFKCKDTMCIVRFKGSACVMSISDYNRIVKKEQIVQKNKKNIENTKNIA